MNESKTDFELLQRFCRDGNQAAFATLVQRHVHLVYGTALRKTEHNSAEEIAQNVFSALARKAWRFAPDDSLPAWLHRTTLLEAKFWLRGELRHRRREQIAGELGTTMSAPEESVLRALVPMLDEGLLSLREKDRTALLLRYYEGQSLKEVGVALGIREDAAQKRVATALESLARFFQRRGFRSATVAISIAALETSARSAPAALVSSLAQIALQNSPPALGGLLGVFSRLASLTTAQAAIVCVAIISAPVLWKWNQLHTAKQETTRLQMELSRTQTEYNKAQADNEKTRAAIERLAATRLALNQTRLQAERTAEKLSAGKLRIQAMLANADYKWPDDFPFVRIPKSVLKNVDMATPLSASGNVLPFARELFGLTPAETEEIEQSVQQHISSVDQLIEQRMYETNRMFGTELPDDAVASKIWVVPALGNEIRQSNQILLAGLQQLFGAERWPVFEQKLQHFGTSKNLGSILKLSIEENPQEAAAWISGSDKELMANLKFSSQGAVQYQVALSAYDPLNSPATSTKESGTSSSVVDAAHKRISDWLRQQAIAHRSNPTKP